MLKFGVSPSFIGSGMVFDLVPPQLDISRTLTLERFDLRSEDTVYAEFAEIENLDQAERLVGCHLLLPDSVLPDDIETVEVDEPYLGWEIEDRSFGSVGVVRSATPRFQQILLEVEHADDEDKKTYYIPLVEQFIVEELPDEKKLILDCPQGLFEL